MTREQASEVIAMTLDKIATQIMGAEMMDNETRQGLEHTIRAFTMARTALREPSYNWNVKECADLIAAMSEGETLTIWKKNGFLNAVRGKTIDAWKPLLADKEEGEHGH